MPDCLSVVGFAPAIEIIGRTSGKIFNRRYTVFTKGDEHLVGYTWNVLETVFNTKLMRLEAVNLALRPLAEGQQARVRIVRQSL